MNENLDFVNFLPQRIHQFSLMIYYPSSGGDGVGY